jgi:hypothetical protein
MGLGGQQFAQFGNLGGQFGFQPGNRYQGVAMPVPSAPRMTYEQLQERRKELQAAKQEAKQKGSALADLDVSESIDAATTTGVGEHFQYTIDHKVSLPRQKSALLPLVNQEVQGRRVSIYNERVQAKSPLLGMKFKNATAQTLMQGPVSVFEAGTYAGDARLPDLQPGEERLLSYAIDQGVEVKPEVEDRSTVLTAVKVHEGVARVTQKMRTAKKYLVKNRAPQARTVIVEHPVHAGWKVASPKPTERSRDFHRFELAVPAGEAAVLEVAEEQVAEQTRSLLAAGDDVIDLYLRSSVPSAKLKEALRKVRDYKDRVATTRRDLADLEAQLKKLHEEQGRLRANLREAPFGSPLNKRYLDKLEKQEDQVEKLQGQIADKQQAEKAQQKEYEEYVKGLTVE